MSPTMQRFEATLEPVVHGGMFVVVPGPIARAAGLVHGARVRGSVRVLGNHEGADFRSSLMKYSGVFHLGVHKSTLALAKAQLGQQVEVTIELDDEPLPTDTVPDDLAAALAEDADASANWAKLSPSHKREHVKHVIEAKKPETRARRIAKTLATLREGPPPRRTWKPRDAD